ncbi:MAG TPA: 1,2-phenylacetyl-CoA epoxidase subunit PaaC [Acidimicrobiia bacterium]|nr:1,2-phenylacetyl-CoA epoxidase subunit PaaC [Acidimicrobiia bacterium]
MSDSVVSGAPQGTPQVLGSDDVIRLVNHADDNLVLAQRLGEWISNAPELELDIALGNIALDHLGVARSLYELAGEIEGQGRREDEFAMLRTEREFTNLLLVEQPNGDFADTIVRQVFIDLYQRHLWADLATSNHPELAGIAARAAKENSYHRAFSGNWLVRLGDGTEESAQRAQKAIDRLWRFSGEMFEGPAASYRNSWETELNGLLAEAGLVIPEDPYQKSGGRVGFHTEHLGFLLAEMQWTQRSYPGMEW